MYGVHVRRTCTPYMYDSVNTALGNSLSKAVQKLESVDGNLRPKVTTTICMNVQI